MINSLNTSLSLTSSLGNEFESKINADSTAFKKELEEKLQTKDTQELKKACDTMEQYMLSQIFKQMKASTKLGEGIIEKGDYEETFESFYVQEIANEMVKAGGIGLSKMMLENLTNK